jgi:Leucine-rich repeat (LRR) protein
MPALELSDSKRLFHSRVSGSAQEGCLNKCREVHDSILKICGGLPSSILIVASLLARTAKPEWEMIYTSTLSKMEQYPPLERLNKILHLGYTSLPFPAKSCFLYLSVFPKNYKVNRDRLIWRWIAEGFIPGNLLETGISYFNELINRSLIQPVFADDGADDEDPVACKVQGAVHDFIVSLSSAENFVTLDEELASTPRDTVRRLSLNYIKQQEPGTKLERRDSGHMNLSQARSLTVLGRAQQMPHLASFQLLRVLDLEDADRVENRNLEDIGRLFNLVYLGLAGHSVTELPRAIGELQHLETLDVARTEVRELPEGPASGAGLQKMVRLLAKILDGSKLAEVVEKMQGLQELSMVGVNSAPSLKFIAELVGLKQLRILGVKWCFSNDDVTPNDLRGYKKEFISCLNKVSESNISSLSIQSGQGCSLGFLADSKVVSWAPPHKLQKLVMTSSSSYFHKIPAKLDECKDLTYLEITVAINLDGGEEHLQIIANLPALTILKLSASGNPIVITQAFRCLKVFSFQRRERRCCDLGLVFQAGAMPSLRKLCLNFKAPSSDQLRQLEEQHGRIVSGLEHLPSLMQVNVKMDRDGAGEASSVEKDIKKHMRVDGKSFKLELSWEKARQEENN